MVEREIADLQVACSIHARTSCFALFLSNFFSYSMFFGFFRAQIQAWIACQTDSIESGICIPFSYPLTRLLIPGYLLIGQNRDFCSDLLVESLKWRRPKIVAALDHPFCRSPAAPDSHAHRPSLQPASLVWCALASCRRPPKGAREKYFIAAGAAHPAPSHSRTHPVTFPPNFLLSRRLALLLSPIEPSRVPTRGNAAGCTQRLSLHHPRLSPDANSPSGTDALSF